MLVLDTETRIDETQRLTFGSYQSLIEGRCVEEGLFYGPGLRAVESRTLKRYVRTHKPQTVHDGVRELRLLSLSEFLEDVLWLDGYKSRRLLVAFNHPFDFRLPMFNAKDLAGRFKGVTSVGQRERQRS